jgi:hypothetical protein
MLRDLIVDATDDPLPATGPAAVALSQLKKLSKGDLNRISQEIHRLITNKS